MAKKKRSDEPVDVFGGELDDMFDGVLADAEKYYGKGGVFLAKESERRLVGLPLPSLGAKYLFQSTVFPLSRMTQLTGEQASGKSTFLYEIMRWHRKYGGRSVLLEAESKDSPEMRASILNYDEKAVLMRPCHSLEDWQDGIVYFVEKFQRGMDGTPSNPGKGRVAPICIGIDSLMGKACRETQKKIDKTGHAERAYALEANLISQYMKYMPQKMADWPISIVGVNHRKPSTNAQGIPIGKVSGGMSLKFQETYEIRMTKIRSFERANFAGYTAQFRTDKNSLGPDNRKLDVDLVYWNDCDPEFGLRQHTIWDWYTATIKMLFSFKKNAGLFKRIMSICDLHEGRKAGTVWSDALGVPSSDAIPARDLGRMLESRGDLLVQLYPLLGIRERAPFEPGVDYRKQMAESIDIAKVRESTIENVNLLEDGRVVGMSYFDPTNAEVADEDDEDYSDSDLEDNDAILSGVTEEEEED